jgi:hypothetical protein
MQTNYLMQPIHKGLTLQLNWPEPAVNSTIIWRRRIIFRAPFSVTEQGDAVMLSIYSRE